MSDKSWEELDEIEREIVVKLYRDWNIRGMSYEEFYNEIKDTFSYQRRVAGLNLEVLRQEIRCALPEFIFSSTTHYIALTFLLGLAAYSIFIGEPLTAAFLSSLVLYYILRH